MTEDAATVLLVEDEHDLADLYAMWLSEEYDVRTAYDAETGLEAMDDEVDAVLLDRRLPGMSGDEFLASIRDEGYDCPVAMVSAVEPDFDVFDMGFDDYLVKPVEKEELFVAVEELLALETVGERGREHHAQESKREALEAEKTERELGRSGDYAAMVGSIESFRTEVLALAEEVVGSRRSAGGTTDASVYREALQDWRDRQKSLDAGDPLHALAEEKIQEYEDRLADGDDLDGDQDASTELLEYVAEEFVAEGFWLDPRVLRALNQVFFGKYSESFVIERVPLEPGVEMERGQMFDVTQAVRTRAEEALGDSR